MGKAVDINALFEKEAFKNIDAEQLQAFKAFASEIEGKSTPEIVALFVQNMQKFSGGQPITNVEREAIIRAIAECLPDADRKKLGNVLKMMETMGI